MTTSLNVSYEDVQFPAPWTHANSAPRLLLELDGQIFALCCSREGEQPPLRTRSRTWSWAPRGYGHCVVADDLGTARAELETAELEARQLGRDAERMRALFEAGGLSRPRAATLPLAVVRAASSDTSWVMAVRNGRATPIRVTLGARDQRFVEVVAGLDEGERVVSDPAADVAPGNRVRARAAR